MTYEELPKPIKLGKAEDLTGQKFGKLSPLFRVSNPNNDRKIFWACYCECGEYCIKRSDNLKDGTSTFCEIHNHNNLVGQKFGHLIVVKRLDEYDKNKRWKYKCLCDCGNLEPVYTWQRYITNGYPQSCGCDVTNMRDLTNQKFGMLTVLELCDERTKDRGLIWKCQCKCGCKVNVASKLLVSGECNSCGHHNLSVGELNIINVFNNYNVKYENNKKFDSCRFPDTNALAKFDFYQDNNLIEFDGEQHINPSEIHWNDKDKYITTHNHDLYKNQWAWDNNIPMKRIPYSERDTLTLERIMSDEFLITPQTHPEWYPPKNSSYPYFTS